MTRRNFITSIIGAAAAALLPFGAAVPGRKASGLIGPGFDSSAVSKSARINADGAMEPLAQFPQGEVLGSWVGTLNGQSLSIHAIKDGDTAHLYSCDVRTGAFVRIGPLKGWKTESTVIFPAKSKSGEVLLLYNGINHPAIWNGRCAPRPMEAV